jgi:hypothetical protein
VRNLREWWLENNSRNCENCDSLFCDCNEIDDMSNDLTEYNCGGFALNTRDWYLPYDQNQWDATWEIEEKLGVEKALEVMVNHMLKEFPNLRLINSEEDLKDSETLVLFRVSNFDDFHFVRKASNGKYYHKMGWCPRIDQMPKEEVYGRAWNGRYDGEIVMFGYAEKDYLKEVV